MDYRNSLVPYQLKAKLDGQSLIFCQYCQKYYYSNYFIRHLQFCSGYLRKVYKHQSLALTYQNQFFSAEKNFKKKHTTNLQLQTFINFVKNKRIIIVGPSVTVQDCNLGTFIDSFDLVVRLNKSLPVPPKMYAHIGSRTDILYNSLNTTDYPGENNVNPIFLQRNNIKYIRCPYPPITPFKYDIKSFQNRNRGFIPFGHIDIDYYKKLRYNLGTRPYTGTCAIADLLHCGVKELYVMGIDFYTYGYAQYYRTISVRKLNRLRNNNIHKRKPQIDLIRRFYLLDKRLVVDNILDKMLLENYDNLFYNIKKQVDFNKIFISASEEYVKENSILDQILRKAKKVKREDLGVNNVSICILGDLHSKHLSSTFLERFDFIIDMVPERYSTLSKKPDIVVYQHMNNHSLPTLNKNQTVIFTQTYKKSFKSTHEEQYFGLNPEHIFFLNPLFSKYLHSILEQSVIPAGNISAEIFLTLYFSIFYGDYTSIYIYNMSPYASWSKQPSHLRQHAITQRMLFRYLLRREVIKEFNET